MSPTVSHPVSSLIQPPLFRVSTAVPKPGLRRGQMARGTQTPQVWVPTHQAGGQSALAPVSSSGRCQSQCPSHCPEQGCILVQRRNVQPASCLAPAEGAPLEAVNPAPLSLSHSSPSGEMSVVSIGECRSPGQSHQEDRQGWEDRQMPELIGAGLAAWRPRGAGTGHHIPLWPLTLFPNCPPYDPSLEDTSELSVPFTASLSVCQAKDKRPTKGRSDWSALGSTKAFM